MSVYVNDRSEWLEKSIDSILNQTYSNVELYLAVDGPISIELVDVIKKKSDIANFHVYFFEECLGLASRLNLLIEKSLQDSNVTHIARMDADDISFPNRIEKQLKYIEENSLDIIGSSILEFSEGSKGTFHRKCEVEDGKMKKNIIKKCPFSHPTVMFKRTVFESGIRYDDNLKNTQDYKLWVDMAHEGMVFGNIEEPLLYFRVSQDFHKRRSIKKAKNDTVQRFYAMRKLNILTIGNVTFTLLLLLLRISPSFISKVAYRFLR